MSVIELLHHNRDIETLTSMLFDPREILSGVEIAFLSKHIDSVQEQMPQYKAQIKVKDLSDLLSLEKLNDPTFLYTRAEVEEIVSGASFYIDEGTVEWDFLIHRGVTPEQIEKFHLGSTRNLSRIERVVCGSKIHPAVRKHVDIEDELGIVFPVIELGRPTGCIVRMLNTLPGLKFSGTCSGLTMPRNFDEREIVEDVYLVEGIFDAMALDHDNPNTAWVTPSSGYLTAEQIFKLYALIRDHKVKRLHILLDNDGVGLYNSLLISSYFNKIAVINQVNTGKDVAEAICRDGATLSDFKEVSRENIREQYLEKLKTIPETYDYNAYEEHRAFAQHYNFL